MSCRLIKAIVVLLAVSGALAACASQNGSTGGRRIRPADPADCAFAPVDMTIHPLTRLVIQEHTDPPRVLIDAHIEMIDAAGDEVKGVGELVLEVLEADGQTAMVGLSRDVMRWEVDLTDLTRNSQAFDRATRTYRFELAGLPWEARPGSQVTLRATLHTPSGKKLTDDHELTR